MLLHIRTISSVQRFSTTSPTEGGLTWGGGLLAAVPFQLLMLSIESDRLKCAVTYLSELVYQIGGGTSEYMHVRYDSNKS